MGELLPNWRDEKLLMHHRYVAQKKNQTNLLETVEESKDAKESPEEVRIIER